MRAPVVKSFRNFRNGSETDKISTLVRCPFSISKQTDLSVILFLDSVVLLL